MSTPILDAPTDTTGWLLEMTGNGDNTVYTAMRDESRSPASVSRTAAWSPGRYVCAVIAVALRVHDEWFVSLPDEPGLKSLRFDNHDDAIAWLTHLANLAGRPVTA
nr:hypothetical protein [Mycobacterium sp. UM_NZ2]